MRIIYTCAPHYTVIDMVRITVRCSVKGMVIITVNDTIRGMMVRTTVTGTVIGM